MNKREKGKSGEDMACTFLKNIGYIITDRNYQKKWGEIDIIAIDGKGDIHFFEVKSVFSDLFGNFRKSHTPEENVHNLKSRHISRVIETYLEERGRGIESIFQVHVICVFMNMKTRKARVNIIKNVII